MKTNGEKVKWHKNVSYGVLTEECVRRDFGLCDFFWRFLK